MILQTEFRREESIAWRHDSEPSIAFTDWLSHQVSIETEGPQSSNLKAGGKGVPQQGRPTPSPVCASDSHPKILGGKWDALELN